jgi:tetratricopeptide (TPR) repeat protein
MKDDRKKHSGHKHKLAPNGPPLSPPEIIPDDLVVPNETILLIPDHAAFVDPPHFVKATQHRSWFSPYFYHCLPIVMGNQHGFLMLATYDFVMRWNGSDGIDGVDIHYLEPVTHPAFITLESHFGHGILTVQSRYVFRTPKGVNLMVKEPPNYPVDGLTWMNAVVETDNLRRDFTFNIKITRPHMDIYIPRNTPLGCLLPYPRYFLDGYSMAELKEGEDLQKAQRTINYFGEERSHFDDSPRHRYMEGIDIYGIEFQHHQKTLDGGKWWFSTRKRPEQNRIITAANGNGGGLMASFKDMLKGFFSNPPLETEPEKHTPSAQTNQPKAEPTVLKCPVTQATRESMVAAGAPIKHDPNSTPAHSDIPAPTPNGATMNTINEPDQLQVPGKPVLGEKEILELNADLPESTITLFLPPEYDRSLVPVKASMTRRWLEEDRKTINHGRFCLPLSMGSGIGWYILSPATFTVRWDGDITHDATVEIHDKASHASIDCHSACGSFTVQAIFVPRTKRPGDYVVIKGISNQFRKPYQFLEAMLEAWWSPASFGLVGILNQACEFTIKKGEPLAQMYAIHMDQASYGLELRDGYAPYWQEWDEKRRDPSYTGRNMDYLKGLLPDETPVCPHFKGFPITSTALAGTKLVEPDLPQIVDDGAAPSGPRHGMKSSNKAIPEKPATPKAPTNQSVTDLVRDVRVAIGNKNSKEAEKLLALALAKSEEENRISFELVAAYQDLGHLYLHSGDFKSSVNKLNEAVQLYHRLSTVDHEHLTRLFQDLGYAERMQENYVEAEKHLKTALEIAIGTHIDDVPLSSAKFDLGSLYTKLLRFDESEPLLRESIELRRKTIGDRHADTLFAINGLACLISQQGKTDEAEKLFKEVIEAREETLGKDSLAVADSYNDLGFLYRDTERYDKAVEAYQKAVDLRKAKLGNDHLDVAEFVANIAFSYLMAGDYKKAKPYFEEVLAIKEKQLPSHDPAVLRACEDLAHTLGKLGENSEAEELLKRVAARR